MMTMPNSGEPAPSSPQRYTREQETGALEALERIVGSGLLGAGERLPALLRYIVREELEGRGDRIKAFTIATDILGRGIDFDSQSDGIARAEMARLRKALDHYNAGSLAIDKVRIEIPRGSFRPRISFPDPPPVKTGPSGNAPQLRWRSLAAVLALVAGCAILIASVVLRSPAPRIVGSPLLVVQPVEPGPAEALADGLAAAIAAELGRQPWLSVIRRPSAESIDAALREAARWRPVYLLETEVERADQGVNVRNFLKRWPDASVRWSYLYENIPLVSLSATTVRGVAETIARDVANPGGAITLAELARQDAVPEARLRFGCLMVARRYWNSYEPALRVEAKTCLEEAVKLNADDWSSRAALAILVVEDARARSGEERAALLSAARALAADVDRSNPLLQVARLAVAACEGDASTLRTIASDLLAAFPNNPDVLADVGSKLGLVAGDWPKALEVEARAMALNPAPAPWYAQATLARSLMVNEAARGAALLERSPPRGFPAGHVLRLAIGGAIDDGMLVRQARRRLAEQGVLDQRSIHAIIEGECWSRDVKDRIKAEVDAAARL